MLVNNLTPFVFGTKVTSRRPPRPEMTLVVRGTFVLRPGQEATLAEGLLDQGQLSGEVFHPEDDDRQGECLYGGDFADFKLNAEVLFKATCHVPGGKAVTECPVQIRVGAWSKRLRAIGPRVFGKALGSSVSAPRPFVQMPITWKNAFGGPEYARNPAGKGFKGDELPTIENPGDVLLSRSDRPEPAGFGPYNPLWPQRTGKRGTAYGRSYRETRAPFFAEDFDWTFFHAAPADQQLEGYLRGDEELTFQNLHPSIPLFTARLPRLRVRAFVKDLEGSFREVPMVLDTLFADLDEGDRLVLTWRGLTPVREDDLSDVRTLLIASEDLDAQRAPEAYYRAQLEAFEEDPVGLKEHLSPEMDQAAERHRQERAGGPGPGASGPEGLDPVSALLKEKLGGLEAAQQAQIQAQMKTATADPAQRDAVAAATEQARSAAADDPPFVRPLKPGAMPELGLRRQMRRIMEQTAALKRGLEGKEIPPEATQKLEQLERIPHDPALLQIDPGYTPPVEPISTDEPGPGRNLAEQDLTGRDLRGIDLRGANLEGAILTRADLTGANLAGARLKRAVLFKARLDGADMTGADLTLVNAAMLSAEEAVFKDALLQEAFFEDARLAKAVLSGARGEYCNFTRADLRDATAVRAALRHGEFGEAVLVRANFDGAVLQRCQFVGCAGTAVSMVGADVSGAVFAGSWLPGARFAECIGDDSFWNESNVDGVDFSFATLSRANFTGVSAVGAKMFSANLRECRFHRATLDGAEIVFANLFFADLTKARLNNTRFNDSSLYGAQLTSASGAGVDFNGANLKRSSLENA